MATKRLQVVNNLVADDSITTEKIVDGAVISSKLDPTLQDAINLIGYDSVDNYSIAFDANGKILWATSRTEIGGGEFFANAPTATKIVLGKTVTNIDNAFVNHENVVNIYLYPDNVQALTDAFVSGGTGIREDGNEVYILELAKNYIYLIDLLLAIDIPVLEKEEVDEVTKAYVDQAISDAIGDAIGGSY
jgi:hypothetical protein